MWFKMEIGYDIISNKCKERGKVDIIMGKDNITCIERVCFIFEFFEKREYLQGEQPPLKNILNVSEINSQSVRDLGVFLANRLDRIASMIEILKSAHSNWRITGKKDRIVMETETFDFNDAIEALAAKDFKDDEYILKIEYQRKWGML